MYEKYPFLIGSRKVVDRQSSDIKYLSTTFQYFERMLVGPYYDIGDPEPIEVTIFYNSLIILKKINSNFISRKFISNFSKRFEYYFLMDLAIKKIRDEVLDSFRLDSESMRFVNETVQMSVPTYLMTLTRNVPGSEFRLLNQSIDGGKVTIPNNRFVMILRVRLERMLMEKIQEMPDVGAVTFGTEYDQKIEQIVEKYKRYEAMSSNPNKGTSGGVMPPCMTALIDKAHSSHHLTHMQRVALGIYLKSKDYSDDYILDIFRDLSDWNEKITRYQLGRLDKYSVYGCEKMLVEGICRKDDDKLDRCSKIRNPYLY